jgi:hypothetical protein
VAGSRPCGSSMSWPGLGWASNFANATGSFVAWRRRGEVGVPYYVVNAGRGRSSTHIMKSTSQSIPGLGTFVVSNVVGVGGGTTKQTLCELTATRYVNVFTPSEASCRECKNRWQLAVRADAGKRPRSAEGRVTFTGQEREYLAAHVPADARTAPRKTRERGRMAGGILGLAVGAGLTAAGAGLGIWATTVEAPCTRPYAECAANGHLGEMWGGLALYILAAVLGLAGLALLVGSVIALFSKPKTRPPRARSGSPT